jgi:hypothetical protein
MGKCLRRDTEPNLTTINRCSTDGGTVGDNITNDSTQTLTGTAGANSTVRVYDEATLLRDGERGVEQLHGGHKGEI